MDWFLQNLLTEIFFGVIILGGLGLAWRYVRDAWRAVCIYRIISTHNNETRTRRKGFHARDRYMDIYESKSPLPSRQAAYNTKFIQGAYSEQYIDKGILALHGLVTIKDGVNGKTIEALRGRVPRWVYRIAKKLEQHEKNKTEAFVLDKTGKLREVKTG